MRYVEIHGLTFTRKHTEPNASHADNATAVGATTDGGVLPHPVRRPGVRTRGRRRR